MDCIYWTGSYRVPVVLSIRVGVRVKVRAITKRSTCRVPIVLLASCRPSARLWA